MKGQLTGMRGVYLVAAELARRGFIASPTSRSAMGADILVTDQSCLRTFSVQVKTNAREFKFWLVDKKPMVSESHIYVLVNLRPTKAGELVEYFVVPSRVIAKNTKREPARNSVWYVAYRKDLADYRDAWSVFEEP